MSIEKWSKWNKWSALLPRIGFYLLLVMAVASVQLVNAGRFPYLDREWAFSIGMDILGIFATIAIFYSTISGKSDGDGLIWFSGMLFSIASGLFLDECAWLVQGVPSLRVANLVVNVLFYAISPIMIFQFWKYLCAALHLSGKIVRAENAILRTLGFVSMVLCFVNLVYPLYFSVDEAGVYQRGEHYLVSLVMLWVATVMICRELIVNKITMRERLTALTFIALPILAQLVTIGQFGISTQYGALFVSVILMYGVLFSDRGKTLAVTEAELDAAKRIQAHMLPSIFPAFPERSEFELFATMEPAKEVGGDFYDFFLVDDDHLALVMADVSGKGIPAAMFMMTSRTMLKDAVQTGLDPARAMRRVNDLLCENNRDAMFVTVWLGILTVSTGELIYADAGHEKLLLYHDGAWRFLPKDSAMALAVIETVEMDALPEQYRFQNRTIRLAPGDAVFQYTDGVTEATYDMNAEENAGETMFGEERLLLALGELDDPKPDELLPHIRARVDEFVKGGPQFDDITMLALRYCGRKSE